jgi:hypothetical protein
MRGVLAHFFNLNRFNTKHYGGKTKIIPLSLDKFIDFISIGVASRFSDPEKLKGWLESQWELNQTIEDEETWRTQVDISILQWAS